MPIPPTPAWCSDTTFRLDSYQSSLLPTLSVGRLRVQHLPGEIQAIQAWVLRTKTEKKQFLFFSLVFNLLIAKGKLNSLCVCFPQLETLIHVTEDISTHRRSVEANLKKIQNCQYLKNKPRSKPWVPIGSPLSQWTAEYLKMDRVIQEVLGELRILQF